MERSNHYSGKLARMDQNQNRLRLRLKSKQINFGAAIKTDGKKGKTAERFYETYSRKTCLK